MGDSSLKVAVRVRPFNSRETARQAKLVIEMDGNTTIIHDPERPGTEGRKFAFDCSYWSHDGFKERDDGYLEPSTEKYVDQAKVFKELGQGVLDNAWLGFNCSLFAYGQTGSGKSYSMVGYGANKGIVPITCEELFRVIEERKVSDDKEKEAEYQVSVSMLEIYNEAVKDLLNLSTFTKGGLKVREHPQKGFYVEQLKIEPVRSYADIESRIAEGTHNRTVASTNMNATSSRAHTIVAINFAQKAKNDVGKSMTKTSVINLVDLAGSERVSSTGATGDRLKEGANINRSLMCLGNCIKSLADLQKGKNIKVPFRDSVLTKLLKNALGGNSKTIMIAALSPADINYPETLSTLQFADRAKAIRTKAIVNESPTDKLIREMKEEIQRLQGLLKGGPDPTAEGHADDSEEVKRLEEELKKNQEEMDQMKYSWEQRLSQAQDESAKKLQAEIEKQEARKTTPHFWNLNEDPMLTGMIVHFTFSGKTVVGNKEPANIVLKGLSVQAEHCIVENKNNKNVFLTPMGDVLINGKPVDKKTELRHNDRVMFGSTHLYVLHHPQDAARQEKEGHKVEKVSFDTAQEEIAQNKGFDMGKTGKSPEDFLLQEDLIQMMPMVNDANAMSCELDKKMKFELALVSPQARGLTEGRTEVMVKAKNLLTGNEFLWNRDDFINRKYVMQEMYQNFMEEDPSWDTEKESDPFIEADDVEVLIGSCQIYLQSLAYEMEIAGDHFPVTDYQANEICHLKVSAYPHNEKGDVISDSVVEDPSEILGKKMGVKIVIDQLLGLPPKYARAYCKYKFFLNDAADEWCKSESKTGSTNLAFNFDKMFNFSSVTKEITDLLEKKPIVIEIWGVQKSVAVDPKKAQIPTKSLMSGKITYVTDKKDKPTKASKKAATPSVDKDKIIKDKDAEITNLKKEIMQIQQNKTQQSLATHGKNSAEYKLGVINDILTQSRINSEAFILSARVDHVLKQGEDLPPTAIRVANEIARKSMENGRPSSSKKSNSAVCSIS